MNLRRLQGMMIGVATLVTLGSTAIAAPPDVTGRQVQVKHALTVFDLGLTGERVSLDANGRKDLVFISNQRKDDVLKALKAAYLDETQLPNGYKVAGWAHLTQTDSTTFTLKNTAGDRMVAEVFESGGQTHVKLWGMVRTANPPLKPFNEVPHRYDAIRK